MTVPVVVGSGLWSTQHALFDHLVRGRHGLTGEVADVRRDINTVLSPLVAVTVEEYDLPLPATAAAIMPITASAAVAQTFTGTQLTGSIGSGVISPPRNTEVVVAGGTATQMAASVTITGLDVQGKALTETITGTSGGAATYTGVKCFAYVTGVSMPAGTGTGATFSIGTGVVIGLGNTPKVRTAQALPLVRRELVDGAVVTTGALTLPATNPPYGAYTPGSAPTTPGPAVVTGSANVTSAALYGVGGTLDGETVILTVNGAAATLTLSVAGNALTQAAFFAALAAEYPAATFTVNGSNELVITDTLSGAQYSIIVGGGTANTHLGLTAATTAGTGHRYAQEYEFDGTTQANQTAIGMAGSSYGPIPGTVPTV